VGRLRALPDLDLVGVYAGGSYALDAFEPGRSDVDAAAVVRSSATRTSKEAIVESLRHESLPCPARGLEFVLYRLAAVREPTSEAAFELNLNTGPGIDFRVDFEPGAIEAHWFPIDRSIVAQRGVALFGPPARQVFTDIPHALLLPLVLESMSWHAAGPARPDDAVLNACRAWRWATEGVWSSKPDAGAWALQRIAAGGIVVAALAARRSEGHLDLGAVRRFVQMVAAEIHSQLP
jgi:hypothetical protein